MPVRGFRSFSTIPLALTIWVVVLQSTLLFLSLGWSALSMLIILVPLAAVAVAVTVAAIQNREVRKP